MVKIELLVDTDDKAFAAPLFSYLQDAVAGAIKDRHPCYWMHIIGPKKVICPFAGEYGFDSCGHDKPHEWTAKCKGDFTPHTPCCPPCVEVSRESRKSKSKGGK